MHEASYSKDTSGRIEARCIRANVNNYDGFKHAISALLGNCHWEIA